MSQTAEASLVGDGLRVEGNIDSEGDLLVEGEVQGDVAVRKLTVGPSGNVEGKVVAEEIMVHGGLTGGIVARVATLSRTARVDGDVEYESLSIENGAEFEGRCTRKGKAGSAQPTLMEAAGAGSR
ncbi:MAG: polymer-forming cytoskeletal protein [Rhodospirillaceae bacterium]|nr:polymer-forming cytoskeletal protein [Rhodospirillaceae bacterium]MCY4065784.1 polymer-forming cytoskeletal protein [Rhodospirillaceae bacterium]MDE0705292.1 polymer-forming cytoskeletal protein [Rhodospirillaceae bacterium]MXW93394.1 polymer-forming cytoskeletal protein [Rhodospirillaceae bacterium]MYB14556.1 polymer-forming cytoskeletal protein [Rhodospirillaceae bacterium]